MLDRYIAPIRALGPEEQAVITQSAGLPPDTPDLIPALDGLGWGAGDVLAALTNAGLAQTALALAAQATGRPAPPFAPHRVRRIATSRTEVLQRRSFRAFRPGQTRYSFIGAGGTPSEWDRAVARGWVEVS
jgi:hypothetical protein